MKSGKWKIVRSRICCAVLAIAMIMCDVPMAVYAQEANLNTITENELSDSEFSEENEDSHIEEDSEENIIDEKSDSEDETVVEDEEVISDPVSEENTEEIDSDEEENNEETVSAEEEISEPALGAETMGIYRDVEWNVVLNENMSTRTLIIKPKDGLTEVTIPDNFVNDCPWGGYYESVTKVIIEDGIKNVPANAFRSFHYLREIELPDSIEIIGEAAFAFCERLELNDFPDGLREIRYMAFDGCHNMGEVILPSHLEKIERGAFWDNRLTYIKIPASVSEIAENFYTCEQPLYRWTVKFDVDEANPYYSVTDNILYEDTTGTALLFGGQDSNYSDTSKVITLRPGTKRIGEHAFQNMTWRFFEVVLPDSVTSIAYAAFANAHIKGIKLSENLLTIGDEAFEFCGYLNVFDFPDSVISVGDKSFRGTVIKEPKFPKSMNKIPDGMYSDSNRLINRPVHIPYGIVEIGSYAFNNGKVGAVSIPKTVKTIGERAFYGNHIKDIYYGGTEEEWKELLNSHIDIEWVSGASIHYYTDIVDLTFADGIIADDGHLQSDIKFEDIAFKDHKAVKSVRFSDWVNKYGTSMGSTDKVDQNSEYFAYVSITTDSFFNEGTIVTVNGVRCEVFDISADGKRISFVTPTYYSDCKHSRVDFTVYESDGENHWHPCPDCGAKVREKAHTWGPDVLSAGVTTTKCTTCQFEVSKTNGRMRMNKTQLSGGYYEVGETIPASFSMDKSYAYSSCYELSEPTWYKGAYSESNKINVKQGLCFQNDTYYVAFEIAIKEELADQYYLKAGGINVRFVNNGLSEETSYRVVRDDPNISGRQIQKVVFSYRPIDRSDLTVVLPTYLTNMTAAEFKQKVKFMSGGQEIAPLFAPSVTDIYGNALADTATFVRYTPYIIQPMIDVPGYIDEDSVKGLGILGCRPDSIFNYRPNENKTGVIGAKIMFCFNPKTINVANVDVEAPLIGEKLGDNISPREVNLFGITSMTWFDGDGQPVSSNTVAQIGNNYGILVRLAPKDQYVFSDKTIFTINGYEPTDALYYDEGSALLTYKFPSVEEHVHIPVLVPMDQGNCSAKGHVAYYQCNECGRSYLDRELTQRIPNINTWLNTPNNGLNGGMIQDTSIHNFIFETNNSSVDRCQDCGIKNINYMALKVNVAEAIYTGNIIDAPITIEGLTFGLDYYISEGADAILPGVYKAVIVGRNSYGGQREVYWSIYTDGMWISFDVDNAEYDYTGKQINPSVVVYDGFKRLTAGKDYTIAYKNNINAYSLKPDDPGFDASKAPTVIVTGKGNYSGKETANFVINPKSINSVKVDDIYVNVTGKPIAVKPVVKLDGKKLVPNKDYAIYSTSNLYDELKTVTAPGRHELQVRGIGNYTGSTLFYFDVTDKILISKCSITVKNAEYDNSRIVKPEVTVKYQGQTLTMGIDYDLDLTDREIGNATVKIIGKGVYAGVVTKAFKITGIPISSVKVEPIPAVEFSGNTDISQGSTIKLFYEKKGEAPVQLQLNKDYETHYSNSNRVGNAKVEITGKGKYTGKRTVTFKITPLDVEKNQDKIIINGNNSINEAYLAGGVKPDVSVVTSNGATLKKGVDYTCTYKNNTAIGLESYTNAPTIIYTFKGNFKGKITKNFNIRRRSLSDLDVTLPNVVYNSKANGWISKPVIKDANGKQLLADKDYKVSYYSDSNMSIPATDADNILHNYIRVKIEGLGSYNGERRIVYRIVSGNIANAQVKIADIEYDPEGLATVRKSDIKISVGGVDLANSEYTISSVDMPKNNSLGAGTVLLQASDNGHYMGSKKVKFKVVPRSTSNDQKNRVYLFEDTNATYYRKNATKKGVRVTYLDSTGSVYTKWIKEGVDYTISYANINKAASKTDAKAPTIIVNFKGKFKGKQTIKYDIAKQPLGYGNIYNSDVIYNSNPSGWKQTKFNFKDIDGTVLKQGVDYDLVEGYYSDSNCTQPFTDAQNIVGKDVYFKLAAKATSNYQGEWIGSYKIVTGDISKAKVTVKNTKSWTGNNVNLLPSDIEVSLNGSTLAAGTDWEIVVCRNNVNRGTATVEIRGINNYGGTKTANFKIVQKLFKWWNR